MRQRHLLHRIPRPLHPLAGILTISGRWCCLAPFITLPPQLGIAEAGDQHQHRRAREKHHSDTQRLRERAGKYQSDQLREGKE